LGIEARRLWIKAPTLLARALADLSSEAFSNSGRITICLPCRKTILLGFSCLRGYVLETERMSLEESSEELKSSPEVQKAYLGI
jgi:ABC-type branched-subunit amino acid transport system ATPase component